MKVIFLDYDGVVNNIIWDPDGKRARYNGPHDGKVNDFQAVQWISEFCQKYKYKIVVTSTWRLHDNYKECLINAGLRPGIDIIGCLSTEKNNYSARRSWLIEAYLYHHPEIDGYLIIDDEFDHNTPMDHLVLCNNDGFKHKEFEMACSMHEKLYGNTKNDRSILKVDGCTMHQNGITIYFTDDDSSRRTIEISQKDLINAYLKK